LKLPEAGNIGEGWRWESSSINHGSEVSFENSHVYRPVLAVDEHESREPPNQQ
jgi:hypothetical protein